MDAAATSPVDMYIMNPVQFVEYSILASKGVEFEYDKENSRIGVKIIELRKVEIHEHESKIVLFNPGNTALDISYNFKTERQPRGHVGIEAVTNFFQNSWYWMFPVHIVVMGLLWYPILLAWSYILRMLNYCIPFEKIMSFKQALGLERIDAEDNNQYTTHDIPIFFKMCEEKKDELRNDQMEYNNFENELRNERMKYNNFEDSEEMPEFFKNCNENRGKGKQKRNSKKKLSLKKWSNEKKKSDKEPEIFIEPPSAPVMNESFFSTKPIV